MAEDNAEMFVEENGIEELRDSLNDEDKKVRFLGAACSWVLASYIRSSFLGLYYLCIY